LVLNLLTGHVSPQFHVVVDDFFETLRISAGNPLPKSDWQKATGFIRSAQHRRTVESMSPLAPPKNDGMDQESNMQTQEEDDKMTNDENEIIDFQQPPCTSDEETGQSTDDRHKQDDTIRTRSGRVSKPTERMLESIEQQMNGVVSLFVEWEVYHDDSYTIQTEMENPMAFVASTNPDVMYLDQAMKEPDRAKFRRSHVKRSEGTH
jgi:hypothetical protein